MKFYILFSEVLTILSLFPLNNCQIKEEKMPDGMTKMSFTTPDVNDEEAHSPWMPGMLKCDSCVAIAYQLFTKFDKFNSVHKYLKYNIPESEILDIFEETCQISSFENYGLKAVDGVNRLSGPGLDTANVAGVLSGGGKWPSRIVDDCEQLIGEIGEVEIYDAYRKHPQSPKKFDRYLCNGEGLLGACSKIEALRNKEEL